MYRHETVLKVREKAERVMVDLFNGFQSRTKQMPEAWEQRVESTDDTARARIVCDYIAGMTDRYAIREHERLFGVGWDT